MTGSSAAIIGCGILGQGWAIAFARSGWDVRLFDRDPAASARAEEVIADRLALLHKAKATAPSGIVTRTTELGEALQGVSYAQESIREDLPAKKAIFGELDELAGNDAILASSTSSLTASQFTETLAGKHRCLVAHPLNPPYLLPAVEVMPAQWTSASIVTSALDILKSVGLSPFVLKKEGQFALTRLQAAMLAEAMRLVDEGCVDPDGVDCAIRDGLGLRWAFMGPFETVDLNSNGGFEEFINEYRPMFEAILEHNRQAPTSWPNTLVHQIEQYRRTLVPATDLAEKRAWRDSRLIALADHKAQMANQDHGPTSPESDL